GPRREPASAGAGLGAPARPRAGAGRGGGGGRPPHPGGIREALRRQDPRRRGRGHERADPPPPPRGLPLRRARRLTPRQRERRVVDVVGPICESGDFLARGRELALPEEGELLAVRTAGAYGFTMASNYNARRRPAEALVDGDAVHLVRLRETLDDLVRGER